ncbi:MAG TPA: hypothetical protein VFW71_02390 [Actinomycetota bacterium]|nr:hypothetical protein [Actinomycetota bacterium]
MKEVAGGKTCDQVSTAAQANPNDTTLANQATTLFKDVNGQVARPTGGQLKVPTS